MKGGLEPVDRRLLDRVQAGVPLVELPFAALAADLGMSDADVLARLARLTEARVLRQIGGIFDTRACGYASTLVAARVAPGPLERAAVVLSAHPGVSHCYERDHAWNLWFTLAVAGTSRLGLARTADMLGVAAGAESIRTLPALRTFKIAARFVLDDGEGASANRRLAGAGWGAPSETTLALATRVRAVRSAEQRRVEATGLGEGSPPGPRQPPAAAAAALTDDEIAVVRVLQKPLALVEEPFAAPARAAGMRQAELLACAKALLDRGVMRRFAGLLNHRHAGFGANVMAVWALPAEEIARAGARVAQLPAVTHCYERPAFADWPFALFSMIHGTTRAECLGVVDAIRSAIDPDAVALLWTLREFKKTRLMLFTTDYEAWEASVPEGRS